MDVRGNVVGVGVSTTRCRGGFPHPPVDFDVFYPSVTRFARATSPTSGEVRGTTLRSFPTVVGANCVRPTKCDAILRNSQDRSLRAKCIFRVGRGDSPVRGNVCEADKRVPEFGEFCSRRRICFELRNGQTVIRA